MNIFKKLFSRKSTASLPSAGQSMTDSEEQLLKQFTSLDDDSRLMQIITMGNHPDARSFKLYQYAILSDPDDGVKCAALKRIHLFQEQPALLPMMTKLKDNPVMQELEPYFSMALNRLGLISKDELEKITDKND